MKRSVLPAICIAILLPVVVHADVEDCREAIRAFKSARSDIFDSLKRYANCVAGSDGHDDCSSEFSSIRSAHDDFENAVSSYGSECS